MAANAYTKELLVSMSDNDRQLLNLIDEALVRMDDSGYANASAGGWRCGQAIEAVPGRATARCQELQERGCSTTTTNSSRNS